MKKTMLKVVVCAVVVAAAGWVAGNRTHLFAAATVSMNGLAGVPVSAAANGPVEVKIDNYSFMPGDLTRGRGDNCDLGEPRRRAAHGEDQ